MPDETLVSPKAASAFDEPLTPFEQALEALPPGHQLQPRRVDAYDSENVYFYSKVDYRRSPLDVSQFDLDREELALKLCDFVRGEAVGDASARTPSPPRTVWRPSGVLAVSFIEAFAAAAEENTAFSQDLDDIASEPGADVFEKITGVLSCPTLCDGRNRRHIDVTGVRSALSGAVDARLPIQLVVPSFPFKDQNPFRTCVAASQIDMGEVALLIHLHAVALAIAQVYPYGCQWVIVSDGRLYAPVFDVAESEAARYLECLRSWRNRLNLQQTVQIVDLLDVATKCSASQSEHHHANNMQAAAGVISDALAELEVTNPVVDAALAVLARGMSWNLNTRDVVTSGGHDELWSALQALRGDFSEAKQAPQRSLRRRLADRAKRAALQYASVNLALQLCEVVPRAFPSSLRATVHPKRGQVAIPKPGLSMPWNGVAVFTPETTPPFSVQSGPLMTLNKLEQPTALCLPDSDDPFVFIDEVGRDSRNPIQRPRRKK